MRSATAALAVLALVPGLAVSETRSYTTQRTAEPPRIDGRLDDRAWGAVPWAGDFEQREPAEGEPPYAQTRFKILYDDESIYVGIRAFDPEPEEISSILGRRDRFPGDWVEINIDSVHDHRTAGSFTASVSGTQGDEFISNDGNNWDGNWDPVWEHETRIDDEGWTAELRIPLSQLRYADREEHVWGFQVQRLIYRKAERSVFQPIPKDEDGWVSKFAELHGIRDIRPQRRIELLPYSLAQGESFRSVENDPFADGSTGRLSGGLDGKIGVTSDLTLDLTVNPDFGQVEADPSVVNLTAFETFFSERRPFFIEGANIFELRIAPSVAFGTHTRDRLFYSRRIGRRPQYRADFFESGFVDQPDNTSILGALKLTGKTANGLSIGVLESVTARERALVDQGGDRHHVTAEPLANYFVGRVQKDFAQGDTRLGGMFTATNRDIDEEQVDFLHSSGYAGGVDFFHYLGERDYYIATNVMASRVGGSERAILRTQSSPARYFQRPDNDQMIDTTRTSLSGHAGSIRLGKSSGSLNMDGGVAWRSPGFEINDMGFMRNADEINQFFWAGYSIRNPFSIFRRMSFNFNQWLDFDYGGENLYQAANFNTNGSFRNNWNYNWSVTRENERISNHALRGGPSMKLPGGTGFNANLNSDGRRMISGGVGTNVHRTDDDGGASESVWGWLGVRPTNAMRFELNPSFSHNRPEQQFVGRVSLDDDTGYVFGGFDQKTFSASFRLDLSLTPELTIQYYGSPFVSAGTYRNFRRITDPRADRYEDRFLALDGTQVSTTEEGAVYEVDEDRDGKVDYSFGNPDFNVRDFNSNLVLRWQYSPGSSLFLVWSQSRSGFSPDGRFALGDDIDGLFDAHPHDVFLIKVNRWLSL